MGVELNQKGEGGENSIVWKGKNLIAANLHEGRETAILSQKREGQVIQRK